jgi:hypothetical protein
MPCARLKLLRMLLAPDAWLISFVFIFNHEMNYIYGANGTLKEKLRMWSSRKGADKAEGLCMKMPLHFSFFALSYAFILFCYVKLHLGYTDTGGLVHSRCKTLEKKTCGT